MARKKMKQLQTSENVVKFVRPLREEEIKEEFRKYFVKLKRKLKLSSSLENVLWLHCKAAGFAKPESFDKGIRHFGYKI